MSNKLTKTGFEKLKEKLEGLVLKRKGLVEEMELARQEGDLSENSAYHQLRNTITLITSQIGDLEEKLADVKIVQKNNNGLVEIGSLVLVRVGGSEKELEVVGDGEADPLKGRVSYRSPIGASLMGRKKGDSVKIKTPGGVIEYRLLAIK